MCPLTHHHHHLPITYAQVGLKLFQTPKELAEEHYKDLSERPFYPDLVSYIISGPVVCMVRCVEAFEGRGRRSLW